MQVVRMACQLTSTGNKLVIEYQLKQKLLEIEPMYQI
jgi:hypothetical protein